MSLLRAPLAMLACAVACLALARAARADDPPQASARLSPDVVAVGAPFTVQLTVTVPSGQAGPTDPRFTPPDGMTAQGPSVSTQTEVSFSGGRLSQRTGITATWRVGTTREGRFQVQAPSFVWGGQRMRPQPMVVTVVPAGSAPRARAPDPFDPFGGFPGMPQMPGLPNLFGPDDDAAAPAPAQRTPPDGGELALDVAPDPNTFLRALVDRRSAVVGEQVTLTVWLYVRSGAPEIGDIHEPAVADFFRRDLITPADATETRIASVGGQPYRAHAVFKVALFPLRAGDLSIGPMRLAVKGVLRGRALVRESAPLTLHVDEPPAAGRPTGYALGDVGAYTLSATVEPRSAEVGGAVAVTAVLSGVGNVPTSLRVPGQAKVEWLEPQVRDAMELRDGKVRGSRTFTWIVRPRVAGEVDLGALALPYWDPARHAYDTARAPLGVVRVAALPSTAAAASATAAPPHDPLAALGPTRTLLGAVAAPLRPPTDRAAYWLALAGLPLAVLLVQGATRGARSLVARRQRGRASVDAALGEALDAAAQAERRGDAAAACAAAERAIYLALERATGLRARGLLEAELVPALVAAGVSAELAERARELLAELAARHVAAGGAGVREPVARARALVRALPASRRSA